jgi:predicted nuclease of predicted toxin-antitoxin system
MRLLLDGSLPRRLRDHLPGHQVSTVVEAGWGGVKNGELLRLAGTEFDVFVTADRNLRHQQNLAALPIAVVVVVAASNELPVILPLVPDLMAAMSSLQPRSLVEVGA